ncbi:MAG: prephenate dehydratase [Leptolyngbyaceae cyanobacterium]
MAVTIAHLGPKGTFSEQAALRYENWLQQHHQETTTRVAYPSILQAIQAVDDDAVTIAIVPVENSIEGSVAVTLDTLWQRSALQIQQALVLPIRHTLITYAPTVDQIQTVYSHPQALGQCQQWLARHCSQATLVPSRSTTESLEHLKDAPAIATIASEWAADLYDLPVLARSINDQPDNCTKFWVLGKAPTSRGQHTSLALSLPVNAPGALLRPLEIFAQAKINLSRIESRPTKRSLGEYLFFLDLEASLESPHTQETLQSLTSCTETIKLFGCYNTILDPAMATMA